MPKKMKAGKLSGPSHKKGGVLLEAEGGEYIIKKSSVKKIGKKTLDRVNKEGKLPKENKMPGRKAPKSLQEIGGRLSKSAKASWEAARKFKAKKKSKSKKGPQVKETRMAKESKRKAMKREMRDVWGWGGEAGEEARMDKSPRYKKTRTFKGGKEQHKYKGGGKVGDSVKTYNQGGYVEGK